MKKNKMLILFYVPLVVYILFTIFVLVNGLKISIVYAMLTFLLLLFTGIGLSSQNRKLEVLGFISLIIFTIWYLIMGYYDYLKWTSSIVSIVNLIYVLLVYKLIR